MITHLGVNPFILKINKEFLYLILNISQIRFLFVKSNKLLLWNAKNVNHNKLCIALKLFDE